jgi:dTDP-4-amino-4,6-dideoxygalactose transaminase
MGFGKSSALCSRSIVLLLASSSTTARQKAKAEQVCKRIIQLPIQPFLTSEDIQEEASIVRKILLH